ncbi:MAG: LppX_LprAFG lipoprotein [Actinomycetota bacterium]
MLRALRIAALLALVALSACGRNSTTTQSDQLPDARELLSASAKAMAELSSVSFLIDIGGELSSAQIQQAEGTLTADGDVSASAKLTQGGRLIEVEYVRVDGTSYLKLSTGGFREISDAVAARIFDPATLLDAQNGVPAALDAATDATTEAEEKVGGVDAYRVVAALDPELIEGLSSLVSGQEQPFTLWIAAADDRLLKVTSAFEDPDTGDETRLTVTFSNFNETVDIQAPL